MRSGTKLSLGRWASVGAAVLFVGLVTFLLVRQTQPPGWTKDVIFDDGRGGSMDMRLQFKPEPNPPHAGMQELLFKVKDMSGYPMRADHVTFTVTSGGRWLVENAPAEAQGEFGFRGAKDGLYRAKVDLPAPGAYVVELLVELRQTSVKTGWTILVPAA